MKVFVWEGVLTDWSSGIIVAVAKNVSEARRMVLKKDKFSDENIESLLKTGKTTDGRNPYMWRDGVSSEPTILDLKTPVCYIISGGS